VAVSTARVFFTTSAIATAAPWRFIGFCEWNSLTTAGTWTVPSTVQLFGPGVKRPGEVVRVAQSTSGTQSSHSTTSFTNSNLGVSITPSSAANLVKTFLSVTASNSSSSSNGILQLFNGTSSIGGVYSVYSASITSYMGYSQTFYDMPNSTSSVTYILCGKVGAATTIVNILANSGVDVGVIILEEIMR
jgi:phosphoenolpyruvate synthase/pyruvate phosphate dikinase